MKRLAKNGLIDKDKIGSLIKKKSSKMKKKKKKGLPSSTYSVSSSESDSDCDSSSESTSSSSDDRKKKSKEKKTSDDKPSASAKSKSQKKSTVQKLASGLEDAQRCMLEMPPNYENFVVSPPLFKKRSMHSLATREEPIQHPNHY